MADVISKKYIKGKACGSREKSNLAWISRIASCNLVRYRGKGPSSVHRPHGAVKGFKDR